MPRVVQVGLDDTRAGRRRSASPVASRRRGPRRRAASAVPMSRRSISVPTNMVFSAAPRGAVDDHHASRWRNGTATRTPRSVRVPATRSGDHLVEHQRDARRVERVARRPGGSRPVLQPEVVVLDRARGHQGAQVLGAELAPAIQAAELGPGVLSGCRDVVEVHRQHREQVIADAARGRVAGTGRRLGEPRQPVVDLARSSSSGGSSSGLRGRTRRTSSRADDLRPLPSSTWLHIAARSHSRDLIGPRRPRGPAAC